MAIRQIKNADAVSSWNKTLPFPKDRYPLRCTGAVFKNSNSGNPMVTLEWELICNEPVRSGDRLMDIDGLKVTSYHTIVVMGEDGERDEKATAACQAQFCDLLGKLNYEDESFDDENPPIKFIQGKIVDAIVYGKKNQSYKEPTPEERAAGKRIGAPIKDADGKDVVVYQLQLDQVLGLSNQEMNKSY